MTEKTTDKAALTAPGRDKADASSEASAADARFLLTADRVQKCASQLEPITVDAIKAIHWCRFGLVSPDSDQGFQDALDLGWLAHDPVWRVTDAGEAAYAAFALGQRIEACHEATIATTEGAKA